MVFAYQWIRSLYAKKKRGGNVWFTGRNFDCLWTYKTIKEQAQMEESGCHFEFKFALTGILRQSKKERNMRNHAVSAVVVVLAGFLFQVSAIEWLFLFEHFFGYRF